MADYKTISKNARLKVLDMLHRAGTSHIGSNFSVIDILSVVYARDPSMGDEVVISKGWAAAAAYYFLSERGTIPSAALEEFPNPPFLGLLESAVPGVKAITGSMGHGLPVSVGIADRRKAIGRQGTVFCIMSDGEMDCGSTWESALNAAHMGLENLTVIVDANGIQAMGNTKDVLNTEPLAAKWAAFGFNVYEILGHSFPEIEMALDFQSERPKCIIARTVKGKGCSLFENKLEWHYKKVDDEAYAVAHHELTGE